MRSLIQHRGVVERIDGDKVFVKVEKESACQACHAKGLCGERGGVRITEVRTDYASSYAVGESVVVALLKGRMAISSVLWGYMLPLVVLLVVLFTLHALGVKDSVAALSTLCAVALYYVVLYLRRRQFEKKIEFTIIKE
jgi:sigma-E factor negative regulatory protein RseC